MVLGKLPVPGRPTILSTVGQGPIALAVGAGGGGLDIFTLIYPFFFFSLKGPLNPKQPTNLKDNTIDTIIDTTRSQTQVFFCLWQYLSATISTGYGH